jgi:hypothetical protein
MLNVRARPSSFPKQPGTLEEKPLSALSENEFQSGRIRLAGSADHASANWMITLMSSGFRCNAFLKLAGCSRRVTSFANHAGSALERVSLALYQCRLLELTLPTTTLFLSTAAAAESAVANWDAPPRGQRRSDR